MELNNDIKEGFHRARGGESDPRPFNFDQINICFLGQDIHVYDVTGRMPYGKYKLPSDEGKLYTLLNKINTKVIEVEENNQYLCYSCNGVFDLPVDVWGPNGEPTCNKCAKGTFGATEEHPDDAVDTPAASKKRDDSKEIKSAIAYLQKRGYVIKKLIPSFKVLYTNEKGEPAVSSEFYKNEAEFNLTMKAQKRDVEFIQMIEKFRKEEEEMLL